MRFSTEHQRNIAFDILRIKREGISLTECFKKDEPVIIYGLDFIGKEVYYELKDWVNVICFIDKSHDMEWFDDIPVFSVDNTKLKYMLMRYKKVKALIVILSYWREISQGISERFENVNAISLYSLFATIKLEKTKLFEHKQQLAVSIVNDIISNKTVDIRRIVLLGTSYTALLSFLLFSDCHNSLYIAERFLPSEVVDKMTEYNIPCLYEEEAGEFYDICYLIGEYARENNIPIYGQDHMFISRPFLKNSIIVIEDGAANYNLKDTLLSQTMLDDRQIYFPFGFDKSVCKVILTGLMDMPKELQNKAECIEPSDLWKNKNENQKRMIASIFSFPYDELINLVRDGKDILFLTEPYAHMSRDDSISIEQQVQMYSEILTNYDQDRIIIKPHPSDKIDYKKLMPQYRTINKQFPIQMIEWAGIQVKKIVMLAGSSCMSVFSGDYEIDIHKEILDKYGIWH